MMKLSNGLTSRFSLSPCSAFLFSKPCLNISLLRKALMLSAVIVTYAEVSYTSAAAAQSAEQTTTPTSSVTGDFNNVIQVPNQNNAQSSNVNNPTFNYISPIVTPANAENDFSFNLGVGINDDVTVSVGVLYQPGRSRAHDIRMLQIQEQTSLLETQKEIAEAELRLLQMQIEAAEAQL